MPSHTAHKTPEANLRGAALPRHLVIMTMSRWDGDVSSAVRSMALELAGQMDVWYWDHPVSWKDLVQGWSQPGIARRRSGLLAGKLVVQTPEGFPQGFHAVTPPPTLPVNFLPPGRTYEAGSRYNDRLLNRALARLRREQGIGDYLFLNSFDPFFFRRIEQDQTPALRIYQSRDDISQEAYIARHGIRLEREQLDRADLRLATSQELCRKLSTPDKPVELLPNAANTALFKAALQPGPPPADWPCSGERPVVGYVGNMAALRMDYALLDAAVQACPDYDFVFIGTGGVPDAAFARSANVHFLGPKPLEHLPDYLRPMDCCQIPFLRNTLTRSIYPLKINEYLAAGKPVVCTDFSADVEAFSDVALLSRSAADYPGLLRQAVDQASAPDAQQHIQARVERAEANSWPLRASAFLHLCRQAMQHKHAGRASSPQSPAACP